MMIGELEHVFSNLEKPEEVAERIHEMKKEGYQFLYSDKAKIKVIQYSKHKRGYKIESHKCSNQE